MPSPSGATARYTLPYLEETDQPDVATASEDLANALDTLISSASQGTAASRPAAGTSGRWYYATDTHEITYDDGSAWITPVSGNPSARFHLASAESIASGVETQLTTGFTADWAKGGMTTPSDDIVVPVAGVYRVSAGLNWPSNSNAGVYGGGILHNGSAPASGGAADIPFATGPTFAFTVSFTDEIACAAADTISLYAYQDIGGPAFTNAGSWLAVSLVSQ